MHTKLFLASLLLSFLNFSSQNPPATRLEVGSVFSRSIAAYDQFNRSVNFSIQGGAVHFLLYRFADMQSADNSDSITLVREIIRNFCEKTGYQIRVICYHVSRHSQSEVAFFEKFRQATAGGVWAIAPEFYRLSDTSVNAEILKNTGKLIYFTRNAYFEDHRILLISESVKEMLKKSKLHAFGSGSKDKSEIKKWRAKLLTEVKGKKIPVGGVKIYSIENKKDTVARATSNQNGDFEMVNNGNALLSAQPSKELDNLILATENGVELSRFIKTTNGFEYKLIPSLITQLSEMPEKDVTLELNKFVLSDKRELKFEKTIDYELSEYNLNGAAKHLVDEVADLMRKNPKLHLEIISHTDATGERPKNFQLSKLRSLAVSDYLVLKGIDAKRLTSTGKGESIIRNRCIDGVECSEKEHRYNRRTEFRFTR